MKYTKVLPFAVATTAFLVPNRAQTALQHDDKDRHGGHGGRNGHGGHENSDEAHTNAGFWDELPRSRQSGFMSGLEHFLEDIADGVVHTIDSALGTVGRLGRGIGRELGSSGKGDRDRNGRGRNDRDDRNGRNGRNRDGEDEKSLYDLIRESENTQRFAKILEEYSELREKLQECDRSQTIFVPTDEAFDELTDEEKRFTKEEQRELLEYHLVKGEHPLSAIIALHTLPTELRLENLNDNRQRLRVSSGLFGVNINFNSKIVGSDIYGCNGIVHVIDRVLVPPPRQGKLIKQLPGKFSTFSLAMETTGLDEELHEQKLQGGTVFAPTNNAFAKLGARINEFLFSHDGTKYLRALLKYHVVERDTLYSDAFYGDRRGDRQDGGRLHVQGNPDLRQCVEKCRGNAECIGRCLNDEDDDLALYRNRNNTQYCRSHPNREECRNRGRHYQALADREEERGQCFQYCDEKVNGPEQGLCFRCCDQSPEPKQCNREDRNEKMCRGADDQERCKRSLNIFCWQHVNDPLCKRGQNDDGEEQSARFGRFLQNQEDQRNVCFSYCAKVNDPDAKYLCETCCATSYDAEKCIQTNNPIREHMCRNAPEPKECIHDFNQKCWQQPESPECGVRRRDDDRSLTLLEDEDHHKQVGECLQHCESLEGSKAQDCVNCCFTNEQPKECTRSKKHEYDQICKETGDRNEEEQCIRHFEGLCRQNPYIPACREQGKGNDQFHQNGDDSSRREHHEYDRICQNDPEPFREECVRHFEGLCREAPEVPECRKLNFVYDQICQEGPETLREQCYRHFEQVCRQASHIPECREQDGGNDRSLRLLDDEEPKRRENHEYNRICRRVPDREQCIRHFEGVCRDFPGAPECRKVNYQYERICQDVPEEEQEKCLSHFERICRDDFNGSNLPECRVQDGGDNERFHQNEDDSSRRENHEYNQICKTVPDREECIRHFEGVCRDDPQAPVCRKVPLVYERICQDVPGENREQCFSYFEKLCRDHSDIPECRIQNGRDNDQFRQNGDRSSRSECQDACFADHKSEIFYEVCTQCCRYEDDAQECKDEGDRASNEICERYPDLRECHNRDQNIMEKEDSLKECSEACVTQHGTTQLFVDTCLSCCARYPNTKECKNEGRLLSNHVCDEHSKWEECRKPERQEQECKRSCVSQGRNAIFQNVCLDCCKLNGEPDVCNAEGERTSDELCGNQPDAPLCREGEDRNSLRSSDVQEECLQTCQKLPNTQAFELLCTSCCEQGGPANVCENYAEDVSKKHCDIKPESELCRKREEHRFHQNNDERRQCADNCAQSLEWMQCVSCCFENPEPKQCSRNDNSMSASSLFGSRRANQRVSLRSELGNKQIYVETRTWLGMTSMIVNGWVRVSVQDGIADDGVVHVIESVLLPPRGSRPNLQDPEDNYEYDNLSIDELKDRLERYVDEDDRDDKNRDRDGRRRNGDRNGDDENRDRDGHRHNGDRNGDDDENRDRDGHRHNGDNNRGEDNEDQRMTSLWQNGDRNRDGRHGGSRNGHHGGNRNDDNNDSGRNRDGRRGPRRGDRRGGRRGGDREDRNDRNDRNGHDGRDGRDGHNDRNGRNDRNGHNDRNGRNGRNGQDYVWDL